MTLQSSKRWQEEALRRLATLPPGAPGAETASLLLEWAGDLLRAGGVLSRAQRGALQRLGEEPVRACLEQREGRIRALQPSSSGSGAPDLAEAKVVLCARDQLESFRTGLSRWSQEKGFMLAEELAALEAGLAALDAALAPLRRLSLAPVQLLGPRGELVLSSTPPPIYAHWELEDGGAALLGAPEDPAPRPLAGLLPEDVLASFLVEGEHPTAVSERLRASEEVGEQLRAFLEVARELGEPRSLAARRLECELGLASREQALSLALSPVTVAAPERLSLGRLPGHDARLSLVAEAEGPVSLIEEGSQPIQKISFGATEAVREAGIWRAALGRWPAPGEPTPLRVDFDAGAPFEEELWISRGRTEE